MKPFYFSSIYVSLAFIIERLAVACFEFGIRSARELGPLQGRQCGVGSIIPRLGELLSAAGCMWEAVTVAFGEVRDPRNTQTKRVAVCTEIDAFFKRSGMKTVIGIAIESQNVTYVIRVAINRKVCPHRRIIGCPIRLGTGCR